MIALNRPVDRACAERLGEQFIEVLLAPGFDDDALEVLAEKKNVRLLELAHWPPPSHEVEGKPVIGGQLVQTRDVVSETREQMRVLTEKAPSEEQWTDLLFAWRVCRHVRSNAIVIAASGATIGIGAGQMSRVDSVRIAIEKARAAQPELLQGAVLASDAYFPSPTALSWRSRPVSPRSSSPQARCVTRRSSPPPMRPQWRWWRRTAGTSGTRSCAAAPPPGLTGTRRRYIVSAHR